MISCTDFIAAYNELFSFVEEQYGRQEVGKLWQYLFAPTGAGIPLINYVKQEGIRGCFDYWSGTLSEEAADFTLYLNEARGYFNLVMHHCPSKGRLLELKETLGIVPYHNYCFHCDSYRSAVEAVGLKYIYDFKNIDQAVCSILIFDPELFDGKIIVDDNTKVFSQKASDHEYYHPDFHSSMNMAIQYLDENHGAVAVQEYLVRLADTVYKHTIDDACQRGLAAIKEWIASTYRREKATDAITIDLTRDALRVSVTYCPAVKHLKATGRQISPLFMLTTQVVMEEIARKSGFRFQMDAYDADTGAASYRFLT